MPDYASEMLTIVPICFMLCLLLVAGYIIMFYVTSSTLMPSVLEFKHLSELIDVFECLFIDIVIN